MVVLGAVLLAGACSQGTSPGGSATAGAGSVAGAGATAAPAATGSSAVPGSPPAANGSGGQDGASPEATPAVATSAGAPDGRTLTLAFGGDVHFADQVGALLNRPASSLASLRPRLGSADLSMVNLETAITGRGTPAPKTYHFRTTTTALTALQAAGVDVVTMANNHAVDYGATGLQDTLAAQRAGKLPVVGIGPDAARAYAPAMFTVRGTRVAMFGASQVNDWTLQNWTATASRPGIASSLPGSPLLTAVRGARSRADLVVVFLHWGTEGLTCPDALQERTAKALAAAGADIVIGSHAHRVQGAGWMGGTFVAYGLGNFVWYNSSSNGSSTSGVLTLTVTGRKVVSSTWTPMRIGRDGVPRAQGAATTAQMRSAWQQTRRCARLAGTPSTG